MGLKIMLPKSERSCVYVIAFRTLEKYHVFVSGIKIPARVHCPSCLHLSFYILEATKLTQHVCMPYYSMTSALWL